MGYHVRLRRSPQPNSQQLHRKDSLGGNNWGSLQRHCLQFNNGARFHSEFNVLAVEADADQYNTEAQILSGGTIALNVND